MNRDPALRLLAHAAWADDAVWRAVLAGPAASDERTLELLHHVHSVQWAYLAVLRGEPPELPELSTFDPPGLRAWGAEALAGLATTAAAMDEADRARPLALPWASRVVEHLGEVAPTDGSALLLQVSSHSTYHRGQVNARVREVGGEPALVDFIVWVWAGSPGPEGSAGP